LAIPSLIFVAKGPEIPCNEYAIPCLLGRKWEEI
jgi:hypothetical protein